MCPESMPVEHWIAAVHHSWRQCLVPEIYNIFVHTSVCMSVCKVTENKGLLLMNPTPTSSFQQTGEAVLFLHFSQHFARQMNRLLITTLLSVADFQSISILSFGWMSTHDTIGT